MNTQREMARIVQAAKEAAVAMAQEMPNHFATHKLFAALADSDMAACRSVTSEPAGSDEMTPESVSAVQPQAMDAWLKEDDERPHVMSALNAAPDALRESHAELVEALKLIESAPNSDARSVVIARAALTRAKEAAK